MSKMVRGVVMGKFGGPSPIILCLLVLVFSHVEADRLDPDFNTLRPHPQDTTYQPSLGAVIGILGVMFMVTVIVLIYVKMCHDTNLHHHHRHAAAAAWRSRGGGVPGLSRRFSGIDKTVVESLPFFRFSSLEGSTKEGMECAVCLSKFEDVEILRLLPKCKHAFHIDCIDHWLEKHSTCPLCRHKITSDDLKLIASSNSMRFLLNKEDSDSVFVRIEEEEEESHARGGGRGSSRFGIVGSSFRMLFTRNDTSSSGAEAAGGLHKHNHKIVMSDFSFNNRWSDLRSSDLLSLNSEMLSERSSGRFSSAPEIEKKSKEGDHDRINVTVSEYNYCSGNQIRSVSEITAVSRHADSDHARSSEGSTVVAEEIGRRKVWLPIATRTIQWFASKERSDSQRQTRIDNHV